MDRNKEMRDLFARILHICLESSKEFQNDYAAPQYLR